MSPIEQIRASKFHWVMSYCAAFLLFAVGAASPQSDLAQIPTSRPTPVTPTPTPQPTATPQPAPTPTPIPATTPEIKATPKPAPKAKPGSVNPDEIKEARDLLAALGYWVVFASEQKNGKPEYDKLFDASLRHSLIAFQKVSDLPRTGKLTPDELNAIRTAQRPAPFEDPGIAHVEIDLRRQVMFIVNILADNCGACLRILPISSGSGEWFTEGGKTRRALTPPGRFKVERKIAGWRKSALGLLYYPNYINDGIAIHGSLSVPAKPASHGCIRIPMYAAKEFSEMAVIGLPVFVYESNAPVEKPALTLAKP